MLVLVLSSCKTSEKPIEYELPSLDAFEPSLAPEGLIEEPKTQKDLMHNAITWEFWGYEWQDYALSLESWIDDLKVDVFKKK